MISSLPHETLTREHLLNMPTSFLAYVGDTVFELHTRTRAIGSGAGSIQEIHQATVSHVRAGAQASAMRALSDQLTAGEQDLVRRARNAHQGTVAKHASLADYRMSTSFECLLGYLYLSGDTERLEFIMSEADKYIEQFPMRSVNEQ